MATIPPSVPAFFLFFEKKEKRAPLKTGRNWELKMKLVCKNKKLEF